MNLTRLLTVAAPGVLLVLLASCATGMGQGTSTPSSKPSGSSGMMDMQSMCDMHKGMMSGKSPAEQQAMMQEHMKSMTPETRQRMQMMMEQCK
jgi:hypothetical protein